MKPEAYNAVGSTNLPGGVTVLVAGKFSQTVPRLMFPIGTIFKVKKIE